MQAARTIRSSPALHWASYRSLLNHANQKSCEPVSKNLMLLGRKNIFQVFVASAYHASPLVKLSVQRSTSLTRPSVLSFFTSSYHWRPLQPALPSLESTDGLSVVLHQTGVHARCLHHTAGLPHLLQQVRRKSRKKQNETLSDSDDDDDVLEADDFDAPAKFKVMKIHTASMRTDAIISNSLNVARNRLEEVFYGPGLLLNGEKMMKKSVKMEEGDYVDLVVDKEEDQLKVKRVKVMKIFPGQTNTEKLIVKVRVWKAPFLVDKPESGRRSS